jgi:hypothetical protein
MLLVTFLGFQPILVWHKTITRATVMAIWKQRPDVSFSGNWKWFCFGLSVKFSSKIGLTEQPQQKRTIFLWSFHVGTEFQICFNGLLVTIPWRELTLSFKFRRLDKSFVRFLLVVSFVELMILKVYFFTQHEYVMSWQHVGPICPHQK